jgi:transcriptional regulator with XRE-family HTH domain
LERTRRERSFRSPRQRRSSQHAALGRALRALREEHGLSQEELGHRARLHRNHIDGIERGELNPSFSSLLKLARSLGVTPASLFALADER